LLGKEILTSLEKKKLNYLIETTDYPTGTVQVTLCGAGIPHYEICEGAAWDNIPFTQRIENLAKSTKVVCFGSLAQRSEVSRTTIRKFIEAMPDDSIKICDINLRLDYYTKAIVDKSIKMSNMLKINDEELVTIGRLFGYPGLDMTNKCWLILGKYNLDALVLTCGVNGSYVFTPGAMSFLETPKVEVADTVGAGDSFTGSFCAAYLSGVPVSEAHRLAVETSAFVCTQNGAMPTLPKNFIDRIK